MALFKNDDEKLLTVISSLPQFYIYIPISSSSYVY